MGVRVPLLLPFDFLNISVMKLLKKVKTFCGEIVSELRKTAWPTRRSLMKSTVVVVLGMFLLGFYVSVVDFSLLNIVDFITRCVGR